MVVPSGLSSVVLIIVGVAVLLSMVDTHCPISSSQSHSKPASTCANIQSCFVVKQSHGVSILIAAHSVVVVDADKVVVGKFSTAIHCCSLSSQKHNLPNSAGASSQNSWLSKQ